MSRPTDLAIVLSPESSVDARAEALERLMVESWKRGWDECAESYTEALTIAGLTLPEPPQPGPLH